MLRRHETYLCYRVTVNEEYLPAGGMDAAALCREKVKGLVRRSRLHLLEAAAYAALLPKAPGNVSV